MPMKKSTKLVKILITNIPIAISISVVASYLGVSSAGLPSEAFMPAFLSTTLMNTGLSYVISFLVGWFIPAERLGFSFARACGAKPSDGLKFGLLLNLVVDTIYVIVNALILTYVNAIIMQGMPLAAFPAALMGSLLPCWVVGYVVSLFWAPYSERLARRLMKDPEPNREPEAR